MDINVKVVVDATEEVKEIFRLVATSLTKAPANTADPATDEDEEEKPAKAPKKARTKATKKPEPEPDPADDENEDNAEDPDEDDKASEDGDDEDGPNVKVSFEKLRALGRKKMQSDEAKAKVRTFMLKKFQTAKLPELTEDQWPAMYNFLESL